MPFVYASMTSNSNGAAAFNVKLPAVQGDLSWQYYQLNAANQTLASDGLVTRIR